MGQYYLPVNLDKKEYIDPHKFGDTLALYDFDLGASPHGTLFALGILLADGGAAGPGKRAVVGSWAGDRIVIAGDYARRGKFLGTRAGKEGLVLFDVAWREYLDISRRVMRALVDEEGAAEKYRDADGPVTGTSARYGLSRYDYATLSNRAAARLGHEQTVDHS